MPVFKYRSRGTNDEQWNENTIEADDLGQAEDKLDKIYAVKRDDNGNPTNTDMIRVEMLP